MNKLKVPGWVLLVALLDVSAVRAEVSLPDYDRRQDVIAGAAESTPDQALAAARLRAISPGVQVDFNRLTGAPGWIMSPHATLSGPRGEGRSVSSKTVAQWPATDPDRAVKAFLSDHHALFRAGPELLVGAVKKREYVTAHNGLRTTVWEQQLDGIPVYGGVFIAHVTKQGELAAVSSSFLPDPALAADKEYGRAKVPRNRPGISAEEASKRAIEGLGEPLPASGLVSASLGPELDRPHEFTAAGVPGLIRARLVWLPFPAASVRLCWQVEATRRQRGEAYQTLIDAQTGEPILRRKLTYDLREASYRVFTTDSPTPMSPGWPEPSANQPPVVQRSLVTLSAFSTNASPVGWIADDDNETKGNNVDAHLDVNGDDQPDLPRPHGDPFRVFDFPLDLSLGPDTYRPAVVVQLFYWCNWMHDRLYDLGFTEASGNFQKDNFGRGGVGGDPVLAEAQDGSGFNNANFTPAPEGLSPRLQMYVFNGPVPSRDGALDGTVVLHEYTHGLSGRLVGGGVGIWQWQTYGMAEGWSDFYALAVTTDPRSPLDAVYPVGPYASYGFSGLRENYYFGIRRYPVSTDMTKDPVTFKDIDPPQASPHLEVPRNPAITATASEVHSMGEVWLAALWEARANLIRKHGPTNGNELCLRLVTDGMKLSPPNPTYVQARNAILLADMVLDNGLNRSELWNAFAKRGLGYSATAADSSSTLGLSEAFDFPDSFGVSPTNSFVSAGASGGPFQPATQNYTLLNAGGSSISWSVNSAPFWVTVSPSGGGVPPGGTDLATATINTFANSLTPGTYQGVIEFLNRTSGQTVDVPVFLRVDDLSTGGSGDSLSEIFNGNGDFDLDLTSVTFVPGGGTNSSSYTVCTAPADQLPTDPTGGEILAMADDCFTLISLAAGQELSLFGARTNQVLVGSNGDLVLNVPTNIGYQLDPSRQIYTNFFYPQDSVYFSQARVAPLYADLNPGVGGTVSWVQLSNRIAVTWQGVPEYGIVNSNTFQVEWFFDGTIRFTYVGVAAAVGANSSTPKVGLVREGGLLPGFQETDFSTVGSCLPRFNVILPDAVTEGQGPWNGVVLLGAAAEAPVTFEFKLSDADASVHPSELTIPAGQLTANFQLLVPDDQKLRGTRLLTVTASAEGYAAATETVQVADAQSAALTVTVPSRAQEGEGLIAGTVAMSAVPDVPVLVQLSSTDTSLVQVPATVTIPAGSSSAVFDIWVGSDFLIMGPVAIGILAHVANWQDDADAIIVADTNSALLSLSLPARVPENSGLLAGAGHVTLDGYLRTNLVVTLQCDTTNTIQVPNKITIEAGQTSGQFDLSVIDDNLVNGPRLVTVQASAPGFTGAAASLTVLDDESPSYPTNPSPAHLATRVATDVALSWEVVPGTVASSNVSYEVYVGTNPVPSQAEWGSSTTSNRYDMQGLALDTTYYWQVVVRVLEVRVPGPVWEFTTAALDHFVLSEVPSPQQLGNPFQVQVTAIDQAGNVATAFGGPASLAGLAPRPSPSTIVVAEVDTGGADRVEFANVSGRELSLVGWKIAFYDWQSWPAPKLVFSVPDGTIALPGDLFQVRRSSVKPSPGAYPIFNLPAGLAWNNTPSENPVAVLLMDSASNVVDFVCAVDADPAEITAPVPVPPTQWSGPSVPANTTPSSTYQRWGFTDHNNNSDWIMATNSIGKTNVQLAVPFHDLQSVAVVPGQWLVFSNGTWTGDVAVQTPAPAVFLQVDDGRGHLGAGGIFAVGVTDNLSLTMTVSPGRKTVANPFDYFLTVSNSGPALAAGVVLIDSLPAEADFVSAGSSQGIASYLRGSVVCDLGTVPAAAAVVVTITVLPKIPAVLTNGAAISRVGSDGFPEDNSAFLVTPVGLPLISVADTGVVEGNTGVTNMVFNIQLSAPSRQPVSLNYSTSNGTATAGSDYLAASGLIQIPPGATNVPLPIGVYGGTMAESNETFSLHLFNSVNALIPSPDALGTITNDDGNPAISIADATVVEGDAGVTNAVFRVILGGPSGLPVSTYWQTTNASAQAGVDYLPASGRLVFQPGETEKTIEIGVLGNTVFQPNRYFLLSLLYPVNTFFARSVAYGTILDDDAWRMDHFAWSAVPPTQLVHQPFLVSLTAQNAVGQTVSAYDGPVAIRASCSNRISQAGIGTGTWEVPFGASYHDARSQVIYLASELSGAGRIKALALEARTLPGQNLRNWTIRLRHTFLSSYSAANWETNWTVVYRADQALAATGWVTFHFEQPFDYNGMDNLLVDLSFSNDSYSQDGLCGAAATDAPRTLAFRSDSAYGDPLQWSGSANPSPQFYNSYPKAQFFLENPRAVSPMVVSNFVDGVWTGLLTFDRSGPAMVLHAEDSAGHAGDSNPFDVLWIDSDGDGMPDEWEVANKLDPMDPSDANLDPDGDGLTNLQEYLAGTDPHDPTSVLELLSIKPITPIVTVCSFMSATNRHYQLEFSPSLDSGSWTPASPVYAGTGGLLDATNRASRTWPVRFYRLQVTP